MLPIIMAISNEDDRHFVEDIYNQYGDKLYKIAYDILRKAEDAQDCFHDIIKNVIDNVEIFRSTKDEEHLMNLLIKCARNTAINKYKREKKRRSLEVGMFMASDSWDADECDIEMNLADDSNRTDDIVINEENRKRLSELISGLHTIYQDVLYLRYVMWMSGAEIARILSISESTVNIRLHRARKILLNTRGKELDELRKN